jgi:hypothetical protein
MPEIMFLCVCNPLPHDAGEPSIGYDATKGEKARQALESLFQKRG